MKKLKDKVALVTGASKGIGAGIARQLATEGAHIIVNYATDKNSADRLVAEIENAGGKAVAVAADVTKESEVYTLVQSAIENFGRLDIIVNNSGIYEFAKIEDTTEALYRKQFDINVLGPLMVTAAATPHLEKGASIINISSFVTSVFISESAIYSGSKGAIDAITGVLSKELGPRGIRVNAVNPGLIET